MYKKLTSLIKPLLKSLLAIALVMTFTFGNAGNALAAGGGRIGGGSFRAPSRTYSAPRTYAPPGGGYGYGGGGGFGFPFFFPSPFFFIGGGGLFSILIFLAVAGFLTQAFRRFQSGGDSLDYGSVENPTVSVARLQVGLLAEGRELQSELNRIALKADTSSTTGLAEVLQETTLALLRHPEYWMYGGASVQQARLQAAEAEFNRLALGERSKFSKETLSNVNSQLKQADVGQPLPPAGGALAEQGPGEYIVVTLLVGTQGNLKLPAVNSQEDMRQALQQLGGVSSDRLLALEVLWTPQADNEVFTSEDLLVQYPSLKLI